MTDLLALRLAAVNLDDPSRSIKEPYIGCQLSRDEDSTRLITISADLDAQGRISCHLETTTFSSRPRFTALSYRWGDETNGKTIVVNGHEFSVTANLHDALDYLRVVLPGERLWVDAIAINQTDIPEKNYQLSILPHIYKRAKGIVSWLSKAHGAMAEGFLDYPVSGSNLDGMDPLRSGICEDEYWHRAWVLQEVGKARKARVCIGPKPIEWDVFIAWISKGLGEQEMLRTGPGRFDRLRRDRTKLPMNLKRLIEDYSINYRCKDPRDKIYSLVGLSTDGANLPMDYGRPLLGVWSDVVAYFAANNTMSYIGGDTEPFCRILRECLGGKGLGCPEGVVSFVSASDDSSSEHPPISQVGHDKQAPPFFGDGSTASPVKLYTGTVGTIVCVGPTTAELSGSLDITRQWEEHLHKVFLGCDDEPESVAAEYEPLLDAILDSDDGVPVKASTSVVPIVDTVISDASYAINAEYLLEDGTSPAKHPRLKHTWHHEICSPEGAAAAAALGPRLAVFKFRRAGTWTASANVKIALVPQEAQVGDRLYFVLGSPLKPFLCHVYAVPEHEGSSARLRPYGTAKLAHDFSPEPPGLAIGMEETVRVHPMMAYALMFDDDDKRAHRGGR